ncbi:MAG: acyltransferase family protein, partial [Lachnospiraceae bacterium]|nr:acyltransferase family protein [Lachnospiraceae bacterium]
MISGKKRIDEVDMLRGIAAVLMILGHSFIEYPVNISNIPWCTALGHFIYTFHMELFFVLAGVVYSCKNYKTFIRRKAERIAVPYIFFGAVALLLRA